MKNFINSDYYCEKVIVPEHCSTPGRSFFVPITSSLEGPLYEHQEHEQVYKLRLLLRKSDCARTLLNTREIILRSHHKQLRGPSTNTNRATSRASSIRTEPNVTKTGWYEDSLLFMLDVSESGLFSGVFVPPPPRPKFLDGTVKPDAFTKCDLCSWAWKKSKVLSTESSFDSRNQVEWMFSLVIVSIISASLGAIAVIIFIHCKRSKDMNFDANRSTSGDLAKNISMRSSIVDETDKQQIPSSIVSSSLSSTSKRSVWNWLTKKQSSPTQQESMTCSPVENHYTHMEEPYNNEEVLYAELDTKSDNRSTESYHNQAYTNPDIQISSAPSSAYYSDLSVTPIAEQAYEVVNLATMNVNWEKQSVPSRLTSISENVIVPSDYV
ncbi:uncharacterized protein LOC123672367 isoform X2 [Harmonia axyridis]|uniref:uncharacterized protein LOC123672367 isoform X2 n=1 Tax=Harmonia axyridis TaxID=115357 RepID=UPI001E2778A9|nr:uncharacterized protein LOC123672367 isoform X2 [Harmonia axyridis]